MQVSGTAANPSNNLKLTLFVSNNRLTIKVARRQICRSYR